MRDHQGRAGLEPAANLPQRARSFLERNEVQSQQAGRRIERSLGRDIDVAMMQTGHER